MFNTVLKSGLSVLFSLTISGFAIAQEPEIFKRDDFDLNGPVKNCQVITKYGQEEFEFNESGFLTKSTTRFTENDYSLTYYIFGDSVLLEIRNENYIQGQLDRATSIAHIFAMDSLPEKKIAERIFSYEKEFLDQYEYYYDESGKLARVVRSNEEGVDETEIVHSAYKDEETVSHLLNGVIQKSVRTSFKNKGTQAEQYIILKKEFLNGEPNKAFEEIKDNNGQLKSLKEYTFDQNKGEFGIVQKTEYEYDDKGNLSKETTILGRAKSVKNYVYQFDGNIPGNWIKQIVTPDNTYKTRRITYFDSEEKPEE